MATMNDSALIIPSENSINVNGEHLVFNYTKPEKVKNIPIELIEQINWKRTGIGNNICYYGDVLYGNDYHEMQLDDDNTTWEEVIKPFTDQLQAEKDRIEHEQEEAEKEYNKFENRQKRALAQLNQDFEDVKNRAHIFSSLGFESDADSTANENITGLLLTIGDNTIQFCDYYNEFHTLNKSQLTTLQNEIIQNAQNLYTQKWQYRTAIENATDNSTLDEAVSQINFTYADFSVNEENAK